MIRILFFAVFLFTMLSASAGIVTGTVKDEKGNLLSYASISVKGTTKGAITNGKGAYSISLTPGNYTLICQYVGFKKEERNITVGESILTIDFVLSIQEISMQEVIIKRGEDPALEIIRQTIKKRNFYNKQVDSFRVDVYVKGLIRSKNVPDKIMGQKTDREDMQKSGFDSLGRGILFLSESQTKVSYKKPDEYKYEVISSRQAGGGYGISIPFFINFYVNNVQVFNEINPRGFVSPISDNAFHYYKFRYEGSFFENNKMIDRIRVTPRRKNEPLFDGYLQIVDEEWRIHSLNLTITKDYQLQLIDTATITQIHSAVTPDIWKTQNQVLYVAANTLGFEWAGTFLNVYSNYNLNPGFTKKTFNRTILSYDTAFNKRDTAYWNTVRPFPLDSEEKKDFVFKDSLYKKIRDSFFTKQNLDSFNKKQKPVTLISLLFRGVSRHHYSKNGFFQYHLDPLLWGAQYNTVEGFNQSIAQSFQLAPKKSTKEFYLDLDTRYGFTNHHFNAFGIFGIRPQKNFFNHYIEFSGGKRVSQFNHENPIDPLGNTLNTLLYKRNYMKIYENWFGQVEYNSSLENGLKWNITSTYEDRIPLYNTTDYSWGRKERNILPNHPYELANVPFEKHQAVVASITVSYQPGQYYIELPEAKFSVGSKYPTLEWRYWKGLKNVLGSDVDFDKWKFSVYDNMNWKLKGELRYRVSVGGFFNNHQVEIPDFQHFNGNQTYRIIKYMNAFQIAPYYAYSNTQKFYTELHVEHHFNGFLTNKIPLFNKLHWNLVAGCNSFYINRDNYYVEAFFGIENIMKLLRIDFITAYQPLDENRFGVRFGFGGILANALLANRKK